MKSFLALETSFIFAEQLVLNLPEVALSSLKQAAVGALHTEEARLERMEALLKSQADQGYWLLATT